MLRRDLLICDHNVWFWFRCCYLITNIYFLYMICYNETTQCKSYSPLSTQFNESTCKFIWTSLVWLSLYKNITSFFCIYFFYFLDIYNYKAVMDRLQNITKTYRTYSRELDSCLSDFSLFLNSSLQWRQEVTFSQYTNRVTTTFNTDSLLDIIADLEVLKKDYISGNNFEVVRYTIIQQNSGPMILKYIIICTMSFTYRKWYWGFVEFMLDNQSPAKSISVFLFIVLILWYT